MSDFSVISVGSEENSLNQAMLKLTAAVASVVCYSVPAIPWAHSVQISSSMLSNRLDALKPRALASVARLRKLRFLRPLSKSEIYER